MSKYDSSIHHFQEFLLEEIAPKYFNVPESNLLRVGMLGYVNEVFSNIVESNTYKISELSKEFLPNTATETSSIYKYASFVKYEDFYATPAVAPIVLQMSEDEILSKATVFSDRREFILDKNATIMIGSYSFMYDYDILIAITDSVKGITYRAQYVIDDDNPRQISSYIPVQTVTSSTGKRYVYLTLDCRQLMRHRTEVDLNSSNVVDRLSSEFTFNGDMSHFNIYYLPPDGSKYVRLKKILEYGVGTTEDYCYYYYEYDRAGDISTLRVSFSDKIGAFVPDTGGKLVLDIYTTSGDSGNFKYRGLSTSINLTNERYDYTGLVINTDIVGDSVGGKKSRDLEDIKREVNSSMVTLNSINTDTDLNEYFKSNYGKEVNFIKKRDDIIRRVYTGFIKLRADDMLISTNTINLNFKSSELNPTESKKALKAGQSMVFSNPSTTIECKIKSDEVDIDFEYLNPFTHIVDVNRYTCSTYLPSISEETMVIPKYTNRSSSVQPVASKIFINRNALSSSTYDITMKVMIPDYEQYASTGGVKTFLYISGYYIPMELLTIDNKILEYGCSLTTNDIFDDESRIRIQNSLYLDGLVQADVGLPISDLDIDVIFFTQSAETPKEPESNQYVSRFGAETSIANMNICSVYGNMTGFNIALDMSDMVSPSVEFGILEGVDPSVDYNIRLRGIPVIKHGYFSDTSILSEVYDSVYDYNRKIKEFKYLLDNHSIDLKFINTHGRSNTFKLYDGTFIKSNNISIKFNVILNSYIGVDIADFKLTLQKYIASYIEGLNDSSQGLYSIYISNLIRAIERDFPRIKYLEYLGINDRGPEVQVIEFTEVDIQDMAYDTISDKVPEYLNIEYLYDENIGKYVPDVLIEFK